MIINKAYKFLKTSKCRHILVYGGAGSGKSVALAQNVFLDLVEKDKTINWLILRKYGTTIKDSVYAELKDVIDDEGAHPMFDINKSERRFECKTSNFAIMKGLDDPEKIKSIKGITKVLLEEATEFTESDIRQIWLRLRGIGEKKQFYYSFNPVDANHFLKKFFFDIEQDDTYIKHTTYRDNKFIDEEYKKELQSYEKADHYYYLVYSEGEWGVISKAKVFHNIKIWDYKYKDDEGNPLFDNERWGMDFGFIHASTMMGSVVKEDELYLLPELYHKGLTNQEWIKKVDNYEQYDKSLYIVADSAEPARIKAFKDSYYKIDGAKKPKGSLKAGIDYLCSFKTINIHKTDCPNAAIEFQNFKRRELKDGTITEEFVEINDDTIAAIRYSREDLALMKKTIQQAPNLSKRKVIRW